MLSDVVAQTVDLILVTVLEHAGEVRHARLKAIEGVATGRFKIRDLRQGTHLNEDIKGIHKAITAGNRGTDGVHQVQVIAWAGFGDHRDGTTPTSRTVKLGKCPLQVVRSNRATRKGNIYDLGDRPNQIPIVIPRKLKRCNKIFEPVILNASIKRAQHSRREVGSNHGMPSLSKRNSNRPSPTPHIEYRLARLERQQFYKVPGIRSSLQRTKMPSPLIPLKRIISPPPTSLQAHPFAIPIRRKQIRLNVSTSHGPTPSHNKKRLLPKEEPQQAYLRKNRSNAKPPYQLCGAGAKQLQPG